VAVTVEDTEAKKRKPRRWRRVAAAVLLGLVAAAYVVWPKHGLELYNSGPVTIEGRPTRFQVLLPGSWAESPGGVTATHANIMLQPRPRLQWLPGRLRSWLGVVSPSDTYVIVRLGKPEVEDYEIYVEESTKPGELSVASLFTKESPPGGFITYTCLDRARFRFTYRQVCESFKVIRQP
jgi:hypothetical protein